MPDPSLTFSVPSLPAEWLPNVPEPKPVKAPPPGSVPAWMRDQTFRYGVATTMGLIGGLTIARWAVGHMFVEGLEDKERKTLVGVGAVAVAAYGVVKFLQLDERWLDVQGTAAKAQEWVQGKVTK